MLDSGGRSKKELDAFTSMAKCFSSDIAMEVANLASRVLGTAMARNHDLAARLFCALPRASRFSTEAIRYRG